MAKHICLNCKTEFEGRSNAKFCCTKCKDSYNNRLKTHPKQVTLNYDDPGNPVGTVQPTKIYVDRNWHNQLTSDRDYWREQYLEELKKNADFCAIHMKAVWGIIRTVRDLTGACKFNDPNNTQWTLTLLKNKVNFVDTAINKYLDELENSQLYIDNDNADNLQQLSEYPYEVDDEDEDEDDSEDWSDDEDDSEDASNW